MNSLRPVLRLGHAQASLAAFPNPVRKPIKNKDMPVFKIVLANPRHKNSDGTYTLSIRMTHKRKCVFLPTGIRVCPKQLRKGQLTDPYIQARLGERILRLNNEILDLGISPDAYTAKNLKDYLLKQEERQASLPLHGIDLFEFWETDFLPSVRNQRTRLLYVTSLNRLRAFVSGHELRTSCINLHFLLDYEDWLRKEHVGARGVNLYMTHLKRVFMLAKDFHNDEEQGIVAIPNNPFAKYKMPLQPPPKRKGSLSREQVRAILDCEPQEKQVRLAKDCFLLSLCLAGINSADLYNVEILAPDYLLEYDRTKTCSRRADRAHQKIHVPPFVRSLCDRYRDPYRKKVFVFHRRYSTLRGFNRAINAGLKKLGEACGIPGLYYYQARHTFASVAHNKLKHSIEDVAKCLAHAPVMRVTVGYVKEDFSIVDEVNQDVVRYLFE